MVTKLDAEVGNWALANEEILIANFFDIDFDLYDKYNPHQNEFCRTDDDMVKYEENFTIIDLPSEFILDVYNSTEDRCSQCFHLLEGRDYTYVTEDRGECWGSPCSETITINYTCPVCGTKEDF